MVSLAGIATEKIDAPFISIKLGFTNCVDSSDTNLISEWNDMSPDKPRF